MEQAGMGIGVGDYDLDGSLDIFKTHFSDDTNVLYRNDGKGNFDDVTHSGGARRRDAIRRLGSGHRRPGQRRPPDLFLVTGSVYPEVEQKLPAYPFRTPRLVFRNLGDGRFEELIDEAGPGVAAAHASRGCAFGDFDNDGDVDVAGDQHERAAVAPAQRRHRRWPLAEGPARRRAIEPQRDWRACDRPLRRAHAGPGGDGAVELLLRQRSPAALRTWCGHGRGPDDPWPTGATEIVPNVAADHLVVIREGAGILSRQKFGQS